MQKSSQRAIIKFTLKQPKMTTTAYTRRMYAVLRRYTPDVIETGKNECFAELTGLRTFFKMSYQEMIAAVLRDLYTEIGKDFIGTTVTGASFEKAKKSIASPKKAKAVSTYKEMNTLFAGSSFVPAENRSKLTIKKKVRLSVPFLGKVS